MDTDIRNNNLVVLLQDLVNSLKLELANQGVKLSFNSSLKTVYFLGSAESFFIQLAAFINKLANFTPKDNNINIVLESHNSKNNYCSLLIQNTGIDLHRLTEITYLMEHKTEVKTTENGTQFYMELPIYEISKNHQNGFNSTQDKLRYPPYYTEIGKRLVTYFTNIGNLEDLAEEKGKKHGAFLRQVNAVITSRMCDNYFKVDTLTSAMSLSRTQLYRKIKELTNMSPSQYLLFFRLQKAKELIECSRNNYNINEISFKVGFVSNSHFSRSFQKQFGFTPSNCKKNQNVTISQ